ncbi:MAG: DUF6431 domain-containing protein [Oscillospiraceae bacterium]|jgi:hypothetical protein|nr:DUF6431 domain-containing protein [Oscillospiraceae bacterium]
MVIFYSKEMKEEEGLIHVMGGGNSYCPVCAGRLSGYGWRQRILIEAAGITQTLLIHRLQCPVCERIHHELPDIVVPYKRQCAETIINVIDGKLEDVCCDYGMIRRILAWWSALSVYFSGVLSSLWSKFGAVFSEPPRPKEIVRAVANANLWASTRSAQTSG